DGTVHIFPYSEAQVISNSTKSFSYAVFEFPLDHNNDISKALDVMKQVGDELREDTNFASTVLAPIDIAGVDKVSEAGVLLKARMRTIPGKQWSVQREYLRRIRLAFEREGVEFNQSTTKLIAPKMPPQVVSDGSDHQT
ncbi:MAG: hypothetical protein ABL932_19770, partial [Terricaulis sp.]